MFYSFVASKPYFLLKRLHINVVYFRVKREEQCKELKAELTKLGQKYFTMSVYLNNDFHEYFGQCDDSRNLMQTKKKDFICYYFRVKKNDSITDFQKQYDELGQIFSLINPNKVPLDHCKIFFVPRYKEQGNYSM